MGAEMPAENTAERRLAYRRTLRRESIERRLALSPESCAQLSARLCRHLDAAFPELASMRVVFCWPVQNEPDVRPLLTQWRAAATPGFCALLPVVVEENAPLAFRAWSPGTPMTTDRYGIPTPVAGAFVQPEALLLPLNAFDAAGYRIGYGGGYFDRTLATLKPRPLSIGVGFELARVESIRPEAHDSPLDAMVTEAGVFRPKRLRE